MPRRKPKKKLPSRFMKHYRALNAHQLAAKDLRKRDTPQARTRTMRKIRARNKPILQLAIALHPTLRAFALKRGRTHCLLGTDERLVRDAWHLALQWSEQCK